MEAVTQVQVPVYAVGTFHGNKIETYFIFMCMSLYQVLFIQTPVPEVFTTRPQYQR